MRRSVLLSSLLVALFGSGCGGDSPDTSGAKVQPASVVPADSSQQTPVESNVAAKREPAQPAAAKPSTAADTSTLANKQKMSGMMGMKPAPSPADMIFNDYVVSNTTPPSELEDLVFVSTDGKRIAMADYRGKKNVVLVFTEGFSGMLCPFCKTHTSRMVGSYDQFTELDAEILVVYPGDAQHLDEFVESARTVDKKQVDRVPFPIVLDARMAAVDFFKIRSKLAHPSTYVIDKQGNVQLAYVGKDMSPDRPSVKALLETLKAIQDRG